METIRDNGSQQVHVDGAELGRKPNLWSCALNFGQSEYFQQPDVEPADIELPPLIR
jgi:hypothetical protein